MDKLINSHWFVKLISFVMALMLYAVVTTDDSVNQSSVLPEVATDQVESFEEELQAYYDDDQYVISNLPEAVTVQVRGSSGSITKSRLVSSREVFVDLAGRGSGTFDVPVKTSGFPNDVEISVIPSTVNVTIQKRETRKLPVNIELLNENQIADNYELGDPIISPKNVEVTGGKETLDKISFVKGYVDMTDADENIETSIPVKIYDVNGNEMALEVTPAVVDVEVPVSQQSKEVPVKLTRSASLPEGISINSIDIKPNNVKVFGEQDTLDDIDLIDGVNLQLDNITEDTTLELEVPKPEGVERVEPEVIKVTIDVEDETTRSMNSMPIDVRGLGEGLQTNFSSPSDRSINVTLKGSQPVLESLERSDIEVYVDLSELSAGEHELPIEFNGPQNIEWELSTPRAQLTIEDTNDEQS